MPVPAPATVEILKGAPVYSTGIRGELVTPTGAAIVRTLVSAYGPLPRMELTGVGYGVGTRSYGIPNALLGKNTFSPGLSASFSHTTFTLFLPYLSVPVAAGIMILNLLDYILHNFRSKEVGDVRDKVKP